MTKKRRPGVAPPGRQKGGQYEVPQWGMELQGKDL